MRGYSKTLTEKFTEAVSNVLCWQSLLHSFRKANDDSGLHNYDEYRATSKLSPTIKKVSRILVREI